MKNMNNKIQWIGMGILLCVGMQSSFSDNVFFNDSSGDHLWNNGANWSGDSLDGGPLAGDAAYSDVDYVDTGDFILIDATVTAEALSLRMGTTLSTDDNTRLLMTGGTLDLTSNMEVGRQGSGHVWDMEGGTASIGGYLRLTSFSGDGGVDATLNLSGGDIYTATLADLTSSSSTGNIFVTEGALYIAGDVISVIDNYVINEEVIFGYGVNQLSDGNTTGIYRSLVTVGPTQYTRVTAIQAVPEVSTSLLFLLGGACLAMVRHQRRVGFLGKLRMGY